MNKGRNGLINMLTKVCSKGQTETKQKYSDVHTHTHNLRVVTQNNRLIDYEDILYEILELKAIA